MSLTWKVSIMLSPDLVRKLLDCFYTFYIYGTLFFR